MIKIKRKNRRRVSGQRLYNNKKQNQVEQTDEATGNGTTTITTLAPLFVNGTTIGDISTNSTSSSSNNSFAEESVLADGDIGSDLKEAEEEADRISAEAAEVEEVLSEEDALTTTVAPSFNSTAAEDGDNGADETTAATTIGEASSATIITTVKPISAQSSSKQAARSKTDENPFSRFSGLLNKLTAKPSKSTTPTPQDELKEATTVANLAESTVDTTGSPGVHVGPDSSESSLSPLKSSLSTPAPSA